MATLTDAKRLVIKIGSALLVDAASGKLRQSWLTSLADDVARIRARGTDVVLVSSGSIALGRGVLGLPAAALPLEQSQAAAAVGQIRLARAYEEALAKHDIIAGQVLVTLEDSHDRRRYLNSRATMETMLSLGVTPIVNENDTIATDEIRYGDNDRLAAQVAVTIGADQLILLSDVDGLYTANPRISSDAKHLDIVEKITPEIEAMAGDVGSSLSKGGMITKIMAARIATEAGCAMAIALGTADSPLAALENGARTTWFAAQTDPQAARKRWIAAMKPAGSVTIDAGAQAALMRGNSLLPAGISAVTGQFGRGDIVAISDAKGVKLGQGLTRYTAAEARQIMGRRSDEIASVLGYEGRAALVHRDDMVL
ncbi:glutamate 5-kinase [Yoonia tamlensis]|uniref:Glutamate 5-kinase n=1 Tax=Yoonia tamlensis TaxID=390270 RepID=A0A1I6GA53_9RHOB|nr:glutamate 5-kinase [Yoonia tamlensis]SFR39049.1 glutamate 5-kinase [Yoonia tamlensis]